MDTSSILFTLDMQSNLVKVQPQYLLQSGKPANRVDTGRPSGKKINLLCHGLRSVHKGAGLRNTAIHHNVTKSPVN
jgi:hypothetical protein